MAEFISRIVGEKVRMGVMVTASGLGISGLSPTIQIRRVTDDFYFDFSATVAPFFIPTGGSSTAAMLEQTSIPGFYFFDFDHALYEASATHDYQVVYNNMGAFPFNILETYAFHKSELLEIPLIRKMLTNFQTLERIDGFNYKHIVYDDDESTPIYEADIDQSGAFETRDPV